VSEEVNRKCHPRNTMVQLSTLYTNRPWAPSVERHISITDRWTTAAR